MLCRDERPVTQQASSRGGHTPTVAGKRDYAGVRVCMCVCLFLKKHRLCIVISNWVNVAGCVCIQGCHSLMGFSFNPRTHTESSPADLALFQSIRPPGEEALFTQ